MPDYIIITVGCILNVCMQDTHIELHSILYFPADNICLYMHF